MSKVMTSTTDKNGDKRVQFTKLVILSNDWGLSDVYIQIT